MSKTYLEITYRSGKPFAAYLYLPRNPGDRSARTERRGKFLVDFTDTGRPIGVEIPSVSNVDAAAVNQLLRDLHEKELTSADLAPLVAA
jgi:hypothetical protein